MLKNMENIVVSPYNNPSIMEPMVELTYVKAEISDAMKPDVVCNTDFKSIPFIPSIPEDDYDDEQKRSFLLMDSNENLRVSKKEQFCKKLKCRESEKIKVVSIFGNTGDGKSHTMNHTFFNGEEVFCTSSEQNSCTIGVWAAMQRDVLCIDTEGLLGTTTNENRRMRMLLKILAISDIVIYRTRSERLHSDMFQFLGTASKAFCLHFATALQSLVHPSSSAKALGPAVLIFHETRNTKPLESSVAESSEDILRDRFSKMNLDTDAFSSLRYIGVQTIDSLTDYSFIRNAVRIEIENTAVRSPRQPGVVFKAMKALNAKFSGEITERPINPFPEQYFTCTLTCESCGRRCQRSMGHGIDGEQHYNSELCLYQHQFENKVLLCKVCHINGREVVVKVSTQSNSDSSWYGLAKYAWSGSVINCPNCGEIHRSRQHWYGNKSPEDSAVRSEIVHVWKGSSVILGQKHAAQMILDNVSYLTETISSIGAQPKKLVSEWMSDKLAPSYWKPNIEIHHCHACKKNFERTKLSKHHCRSCGEGFCNECSKYQMPVPSRGWYDPVRVCNGCREMLLNTNSTMQPVKRVERIERNSHAGTTTALEKPEGSDVLFRKYSEVVYNGFTTVASAVIDYPKDLIKDSARPDYWVPDSEAPNCFLCRAIFGTAEELAIARSQGASSAAIVAAAAAAASSSNEGTPKHSSNNRPVLGDCRRHHCRACGQNVCDSCSQYRRPVPERGWCSDVRVCDACIDKTKVD